MKRLYFPVLCLVLIAITLAITFYITRENKQRIVCDASWNYNGTTQGQAFKVKAKTSLYFLNSEQLVFKTLVQSAVENVNHINNIEVTLKKVDHANGYDIYKTINKIVRPENAMPDFLINLLTPNISEITSLKISRISENMLLIKRNSLPPIICTIRS